jgi:hypothetical protein
MSKSPKLVRHYQCSSAHAHTWWRGVKSDSLEPVHLPVGLEVSVCQLIRALPSKKSQAAKDLLRLTDEG